MSEQLIVQVPLKHVMLDRDFNSRKTYDRIEELAEKIKAQGQITPIVVEPTGNDRMPYRLIAGFRRYLAVQALKGETINAIVREPSKTEKEAFLVNFSENVARDELTAFEVAASLSRMKNDYKMSAKEIQAFLNVSKGFSKSNVNHLTSAIEKLHPKILKAWQAEHPACTMQNIIKWKSLEAAEQLEAFEEAAALKSEAQGGEAGEGEGDEKAATQTRISRAKIEDALLSARAALKEGVKGAEYVVASLKFVLGFKDSVALKAGDVIFYDPRTVEVEEDDAE